MAASQLTVWLNPPPLGEVSLTKRTWNPDPTQPGPKRGAEAASVGAMVEAASPPDRGAAGGCCRSSSGAGRPPQAWGIETPDQASFFKTRGEGRPAGTHRGGGRGYPPPRGGGPAGSTPPRRGSDFNKKPAPDPIHNNVQTD